MKSNAFRFALHVILPLLAGLAIYYFFRPDVAVIRWFTERRSLVPVDQLSPVAKWLVLSGPDFCWSYSLASALYTWERWQGNRWCFFPFVITGVLVFSELVQALLLPGFTFDVLDLIAVILAAILSALLVRQKKVMS